MCPGGPCCSGACGWQLAAPWAGVPERGPAAGVAGAGAGEGVEVDTGAVAVCGGGVLVVGGGVVAVVALA